MLREMLWPEGTVGRIRTHHKSDGNYGAAAVLTHDSPPGQDEVSVRLLEDYYCCETGDVIETQRYLFTPKQRS